MPLEVTEKHVELAKSAAKLGLRTGNRIRAMAEVIAVVEAAGYAGAAALATTMMAHEQDMGVALMRMRERDPDLYSEADVQRYAHSCMVLQKLIAALVAVAGGGDGSRSSSGSGADGGPAGPGTGPQAG